jgi:AraC-like DNA-binding protein
MTEHGSSAARGILHPALAPGRFVHEQLAPSPDLAPWIEHHWFVAWDLRGQPPRVQATLPHPNVHLVVEDGEVKVWGVQRARFTRTLSGRGCVHGVKFRVAAFPAFHPSPVTALADQHVEARQMLGDDAQRLIDPALTATADAGRERIEDLLRSKLPATVDARAEHLAEIVCGIGSDSTITTVDQLCRATGESLRRLQRDFHYYVGASPKWVIARYRLHEAVALLQSGEAKPDADLAQRLGYFDQAHFIRDFRRLVGETPRGYVETLRRDAEAASAEDESRVGGGDKT